MITAICLLTASYMFLSVLTSASDLNNPTKFNGGCAGVILYTIFFLLQLAVAIKVNI